MRHCNASGPSTLRRARPIACAGALVLGLALSSALPAHADRVRPPPVPAGLEVDEGNRAFFMGHAVGTQNYVCLPSGSGVVWKLFTPEATLFDQRGRQLTTHFFSPNPFANDAFGPAWQHSRDTSTVWGQLHTASSDPAYVAPGALPWLLLDVVGAAGGPTGGHALTAATQIHRVNTDGGIAPSTGCAAATDVGNKAFVPYTADYYFYRPTERHDD